jgi:hypothetical protein
MSTIPIGEQVNLSVDQVARRSTRTRYQTIPIIPTRCLQQVTCALLRERACGVRAAARSASIEVQQWVRYSRGLYRVGPHPWMRLTRTLGLSDRCALLLHYAVMGKRPNSKRDAAPDTITDLTDAVVLLALKRYPSPTLRAIAKRYYDALAAAAVKPPVPPADPAP